jgi:hypothetical protein
MLKTARKNGEHLNSQIYLSFCQHHGVPMNEFRRFDHHKTRVIPLNPGSERIPHSWIIVIPNI